MELTALPDPLGRFRERRLGKETEKGEKNKRQEKGEEGKGEKKGRENLLLRLKAG